MGPGGSALIIAQVRRILSHFTKVFLYVIMKGYPKERNHTNVTHIVAQPTNHQLYALPLKRRDGDGGIDVASPQEFVLEPGETIRIDSGWRFQCPEGWHLLAVQKSRHAGVLQVEAPLIDNSYRGSVHIVVTNTDDIPYHIERGDYLMQLVPIFSPFMEIVVDDQLSMTVTERGDGAFGSTEQA